VSLILVVIVAIDFGPSIYKNNIIVIFDLVLKNGDRDISSE
jgi:hypothetical protein